jgi:hypothetical protein
VHGSKRILLTLLLTGCFFAASAEEKKSLWTNSGSTPIEWLRVGYFYVSTIPVELAPNEAPCTVALVGRRTLGGTTPIVGLALWRGSGKQARRLASVTWTARESWNHAITREDLLDLDGDGHLEVGVREAVGSDGDWIRATTWYRIAGRDLLPVYHLARRVRMFDREERRDMVIEAPGRIRERISVEQKAPGVGNEIVRHEYDVQYHYSSALGRFAPVSTRVLR